MKKRPIVAFLYDFDYTLCQKNMQDFGLVPALGLTPDEFWGKAAKFVSDTGCERILSYMNVIVEECKRQNIKCDRKWFNNLGKNIQYFPGVLDWFKRINAYAKKRGIDVEHYLISSGNKEIVEGCAIAKEFREIYACEFCFDPKTHLPTWPKLVINYTQKTQFFYRISKGVTDIHDDVNINRHSSKPRIDHRNIVYIGDGLTDVPAMTVVKNSGGRSIAVYSGKKKDTVISLMNEGRVNYACNADYRENKELDKVAKLIIDNIAIMEKLAHREEKEKKKL